MDDIRKSELYQRWDDGFVVRRMRSDEGQQVIKWIGFDRPISSELNVLLDASGENIDDDLHFVGELNGEMVASLVVTPVADDVRYTGLFYVVEGLRRSGIAGRMLTRAHDMVECRKFSGMICFDTFPQMQPMFAKLDYEPYGRLTRYRGVVSTDVNCTGFGTNLRQVTVKALNSTARFCTQVGWQDV